LPALREIDARLGALLRSMRVSATFCCLHVEVDVEQAVSLVQAFGPIGQTAVKATSITLAAADFGKSTMSVSAPA
jgi:hypothetical protein